MQPGRQENPVLTLTARLIGHVNFIIDCSEKELDFQLPTWCDLKVFFGRKALKNKTFSFHRGFLGWSELPALEKGNTMVRMWDRVELERLELNVLAMLCLRIVESGVANCDEREEAGRLRREWALLIGNTNPVLPELNTQQNMEAPAEALRHRMVTYLAGFSHVDSSQALHVSISSTKAGRKAAGYSK